MKAKELEKVALKVRRAVIEAACRSKCAHVGSALSCADLLTALYFHELAIDKKDWAARDIFVLSKAHAALALYAVLAEKGLITRQSFQRYLLDGGLPGHLDRFTGKAIEVSAGSLGHGFNIALGMAHGFKLRNDKRKIFTLIGDGETQEGSVWEGALFASKLKIDNFTAIMDRNDLQGYGRPSEICSLEPLLAKWRAFGWQAYAVDGHDMDGIAAAFKKPSDGRPKIILAKTLKGKGVSFMEDQLKWHYYTVTGELREKALSELY
jgi:transketolase